MNIVYLHQYFVTPDQAGGTRSYELARRLVAAGHRVDLITTDQNALPGAAGWRESNEGGIRVHWALVPYHNAMSFAQRVTAFVRFAVMASRRAAAVKDADVIFATSTPLTIAIPALYASWRLRRPYVFEIRDVWPAVPIAIGAIRNPVLKFLARRLEHMAYHRASRVVALAPGMGDEVRKTGYPASRITIIPNGCDHELFGSEAAIPSSLVAADGWLGQSPLIIFAGTLGMVNGVERIVDVAAEMLEIDPDVRFAILGSGRCRNQIADHARARGVLDCNLLMVEAMPKHELAAWLQRSTLSLALFTGPAIVWKDSVQNKFFDALAAGKPVVSSHDSWQNSIAVEHDVGFSVDFNEPAPAAAQLARAVRDTDWLAGVKERAVALATGPYSRDAQAQQLGKVLTDAAGGAS